MSFRELYFSIEGRIGRATWWKRGWLLCVAVALVANLADMVLGTGFIKPLSMIVAVWVSIVLSAKRLHDHDMSAWWLLVGLIPGLGTLYLFLMCGYLKGDDGNNHFGRDPRVGTGTWSIES